MKNIYDYLERLKNKPWMYIWENNIDKLHIHLEWFKMFWYINNIKNHSNPPFDLFHDYIWVEYWYYESTSWWSWILADQYWAWKEALDKFFEHLENFKEKFWKMSQEEIIKYFDERWYDVRSRFE